MDQKLSCILSLERIEIRTHVHFHFHISYFPSSAAFRHRSFLSYPGCLSCSVLDLEQRHPWMADGEPASWQASLKDIYDDQSITTYVPGHGAVCEKDGLKSLQDYFANLRELTNTAMADSTQSQLLTQPIPKKYQNWYFSRFYQSNVKFLLSSREGRID